MPNDKPRLSRRVLPPSTPIQPWRDIPIFWTICEVCGGPATCLVLPAVDGVHGAYGTCRAHFGQALQLDFEAYGVADGYDHLRKTWREWLSQPIWRFNDTVISHFRRFP